MGDRYGLSFWAILYTNVVGQGMIHGLINSSIGVKMGLGDWCWSKTRRMGGPWGYLRGMEYILCMDEALSLFDPT